MGITRFSPLSELDDLGNWINRLIGASPLLRAAGESSLTQWRPSVDVSEKPDEYVLRAELPSVKKEDINISVRDRVLRLHGERRQEHRSDEERIRRVERSYGSFSRTFALPDDADADAINAEYNDGVLSVHIGRMKSDASPSKQVPIN